MAGRTANLHICSHEGCKKSFPRPSKLKQHMRIHSGERPFTCPDKGCNRSYTRAAHLKRHVQRNHMSHSEDEDVETFKCTTDGCEKIFKTKQSLKKHIRRSHECKPYKCSEQGCEENFHKKAQLRRHLHSHKGIDPYQCEKCGRRFSQGSHLERHKKIHEGYKCTEEGCQATFTLWTLLRKHKATEHVKQIQCADCGKSFLTERALKVHKRSHQESREMYVCPEESCERAYFDKRNLNAHLRIYHGGHRFKCQETSCGRTFSTKQKLIKHKNVHDPNRPLPTKKSRKGKSRVSMAMKLASLPPDKVDKSVQLVYHPASDLVAVVPVGQPVAETIARRLEEARRQAEADMDSDINSEEDSGPVHEFEIDLTEEQCLETLDTSDNSPEEKLKTGDSQDPDCIKGQSMKDTESQGSSQDSGFLSSPEVCHSSPSLQG